MGEVAIAAVFCTLLAGGDTEVRHFFDANGVKRHVRVDCETPTHVIEIGLDGSDSIRDSMHQALFSAYLTDYEKIPAVVLVDRDGIEDRHELEMRRIVELAGVVFGRCPAGAIERWAATAGMRAIPNTEDDLPGAALSHASCDLDALSLPEVTGVVGVSAPLDAASE